MTIYSNPKTISPQEIVKMLKKLVPQNRKKFTPAKIKKHVFSKIEEKPEPQPETRGFKK